ncbi:unnamed protein product [Pylaiella littoralis]
MRFPQYMPQSQQAGPAWRARAEACRAATVRPSLVRLGVVAVDTTAARAGAGAQSAAVTQGGKAGTLRRRTDNIRTQRTAQYDSLQRLQLAGPGDLRSPDTCRKCSEMGHDPHQMHLTGAWQICLWCKLAGHRQPACTNAFGPDV